MTVIPIVPAPAVPDAAEAERAAATQFFRNYTQRQARAPLALWWAARAVALAATLALAALLIVNPALGLTLFWKLAIPLVPALLVIAPGLWRQVCPMATMNQIPRLAGWQRPAELPAWAKASAFGIAVALFVAAVALRVPLLNHAGPVVGAGLIVVLALALAGGFAFKGRSGWCGTFCPLAPIQRTYGQAPLFVVKNGYCEPCVGCQKSCYDFNPRAAVFSDVYDEDPRHAAQRQLFFGLLPGLILGYFLQGADPAYGTGTHLAILLASVCASAGLFALARAFLPVSAYRVALGFSVLALASFYWFAGPLVVGTLAGLAGAEAPAWLVTASRGAGLALAAALAASGLYAERRWQRAAKKQQQPAAAAPARAGAGAALREQLAAHAGAEVTDRGSGITFTADGEQTLLEAIQAAGLKINYGCRAGVCGADPVAVCEGGENLSAPSDDELATLRRLGLEGRARMACVCTVNGPVTIDRDPANAPAPVAVAPTQAPLRDRAREQGLERVVIVGNGVAGMGVAEALRRGSDSLQIDIVGNEPFAFYNRMGIGRLVYDGAGLEALTLVPPDWPERQRIGVHRGQVAVRIDRDDRLVIATGARSTPPDAHFLKHANAFVLRSTGARSTPPDAHFLRHANAFVLRSAEDAQAMRHYATRAQAKRALVVGGGGGRRRAGRGSRRRAAPPGPEGDAAAARRPAHERAARRARRSAAAGLPGGHERPARWARCRAAAGLPGGHRHPGRHQRLGAALRGRAHPAGGAAGARPAREGRSLRGRARHPGQHLHRRAGRAGAGRQRPRGHGGGGHPGRGPTLRHAAHRAAAQVRGHRPAQPGRDRGARRRRGVPRPRRPGRRRRLVAAGGAPRPAGGRPVRGPAGHGQGLHEAAAAAGGPGAAARRAACRQPGRPQAPGPALTTHPRRA